MSKGMQLTPQLQSWKLVNIFLYCRNSEYQKNLVFFLQIGETLVKYVKGTVSVISNETLCKNGIA